MCNYCLTAKQSLYFYCVTEASCEYFINILIYLFYIYFFLIYLRGGEQQNALNDLTPLRTILSLHLIKTFLDF